MWAARDVWGASQREFHYCGTVVQGLLARAWRLRLHEPNDECHLCVKRSARSLPTMPAVNRKCATWVEPVRLY